MHDLLKKGNVLYWGAQDAEMEERFD
eukprot:COSAG02_NODE_49565_length_326_cov_0.669604_1_plen_25_part_01